MLARVEHADDVPMVEPRGQASLAEEAPAERLVGGEVVGEQLERGLSGALVDGAVDECHAAGSEQLLEPEVSDVGQRLQSWPFFLPRPLPSVALAPVLIHVLVHGHRRRSGRGGGGQVSVDARRAVRRRSSTASSSGTSFRCDCLLGLAEQGLRPPVGGATVARSEPGLDRPAVRDEHGRRVRGNGLGATASRKEWPSRAGRRRGWPA